MVRPAVWVPYLAAMVVVVVGVDLVFFRLGCAVGVELFGHLFGERLLINAGIVAAFVAFYLRFVRHL